MTDLRKAAEMALEALERCEYGVISNGRLKNSIETLRQALAMENFSEVNQELEQELAQEQEPEWIEDGFGTMWQKCGKKDCGKFVVRVGKVDCWNGDCPELKEKNA